MLLRDVPAVGVALAFMLSPGIFWAILAYPSPSRIIRLGLGLALGLAIQVTLAAPLAMTVGITQVSVAVSTLITLVAAVALGVAMRVRAPRLSSLTAGRRLESSWLVVIITTSALIGAIPLAFWSIPDGWDPSAHALLASIVIATGKLPTWRPYEAITTNYPYGTHVLLANLSLLTGLAPDKVFSSLLNVFVPVMANLQIYALARRMWRRGSLALAATGAYALFGFANSVAYPSWGGLPNALGLILLLALLEPLFAPGYTRRRVILAGFLLSATTLTHHHVTLTATLILGGFSLCLAATLYIRGLGVPTTTRMVARRRLVRVVAVCALGMFFAIYELAPYLIHGAQTLGNTGVFGDFHEYSGWPFDKNGIVLWITATLGIGIALGRVWRQTPMGARLGDRLRQTTRLLSPRSAASEAQLLSAVALVVMFGAFVFGQFIFKDIVWALYHKDSTAFSPPRFLSNMTYFLALYAAPSLIWIWDFGQRSMLKSWPVVSRLTVLTMRGSVVLGSLAVAITSLRASGQIGSYAGQLSPGDLAAFQWVRENTPPQTIVIALTPNDEKWAPYFTQREALYTPLPASEDATGYVAEKRDIIFSELSALGANPRLGMVTLASAGDAWFALEGRPVVVIVNRAMPELGKPVFIAQTVRVYLTHSLETLAPVSGPLPRISLFWRSSSSNNMSPTWMARNTNLINWTRGASNDVGPDGARWLVMRLSGPLPADAGVVCDGEDGAQLWVDGVSETHACSGTITKIPEISAPGPHVIGVYVWKGAHADPWIDVMLLACAPSS